MKLLLTYLGGHLGPKLLSVNFTIYKVVQRAYSQSKTIAQKDIPLGRLFLIGTVFKNGFKESFGGESVLLILPASSSVQMLVCL